MEHDGWNFQGNYNLSTNRRSIRPEDELVELLWRDGKVFLQSQTQKHDDHHQETLRSNNLLEDQETISWIQYPPDEEDLFETDELERQRSVSEMVKHVANPDSRLMPPPKFSLTDSSSGNKEQYSVMTIGPSHYESYQSQNDLDVSMSHIKEIASGRRSITTNHKRNHIMDTDESVSQANVNDNKWNQRSKSTGRSRAAEVHNLSERRRRDRINERIKTLQELIPHCTKTDKASILDEAIEYLKSLQLQIQVMWMGSGMAASDPMMFPEVSSPPFIRQMQWPVQFPRFLAMNQSKIQNNLGLVCQNQILPNRFGRYIDQLPQIQAASQTVEMLRYDSPAGEKSQQPMKTTDGPCLDH